MSKRCERHPFRTRKTWLKEQAAENLRKARADPKSLVHPDVLEHWEWIVSTLDLEREIHERP